MFRIKLHYFLSFAVMGCVMPLLPVYLKLEKGFTETQIGIAWALSSAATVLAPGVVTFFADLHTDTRRIFAGSFLIAGVSLALMHGASGVVIPLVLFGIYSLAYVPMTPLQDGFYFSCRKAAAGEGRRVEPYSRVRVFGTVGFLVPSVLLFLLFHYRESAPLAIILTCGVGVSLAAVANSFALPRVRLERRGRSRETSKEEDHPTIAALRILWGPDARIFCIALVLGFFGASAYYGFFPLYLTEIVGLRPQWVGLVIGLGVCLEIFVILKLDRLLPLLGFRGLMVLGFLGMALRLALLAMAPGIFTALVVQVVHGLEILALFVLPVLYLNRLAGDHFRNSIQGVYTMIIVGGSRIVGNLIAGRIAEADLLLLFLCGAAMSSLAALVVLLFFHPREITSRDPLNPE